MRECGKASQEGKTVGNTTAGFDKAPIIWLGRLEPSIRVGWDESRWANGLTHHGSVRDKVSPDLAGLDVLSDVGAPSTVALHQ